MGIRYSVYCGPAAVCIPGKKETLLQKSAHCLKCSPLPSVLSEAPAKGKAKFCSECGSPLKDISYLALTEQSEWDVTEKTKEALYSLNTEGGDEKNHVFAANQRRNAPRDFDYENRTEVTELTPQDITAELDWFRYNFAAELKTLNEIYGEQNVAVKFVIIGRWS